MAKKLAEIKTKENEASVEDFIGNVKSEAKQKDSMVLLKLMQKATKQKPKMWGASLIGFGSRVFESPKTGRAVNWFTIGFSPRAANFSIYLMIDFKKHASDLKKLGKHKTGMGCLYINKLEDVDMKVLEKLIADGVKANK